MSKAPSDCVAVESGGRSFVFYIDKDGLISVLRGPDSGAEVQGDGANYGAIFVKIDDKFIATHDNFQIMAAVAYEDNNGDRQAGFFCFSALMFCTIRLYYVNKRKVLEEICRTNGQDWYRGTLGSASNQTANTVADGSCITANVQRSSGQLKVFFSKKEDAPRMSCAYVDLGKKNWSTRIITPDDIAW
ncbi:hypothetical protein P154DRAFT_535883 [Amniculicola lignicola CBS 123094]|uniref:Fucose-specific lectin n=1 Tax=Amniculicola lignicola CBS 123094 TaxID=1392246 RepID=A0A6A5WAU3_9PLEO|nr:hypothetical protein P154DRAFT_535883 [Amniculicola lignicola CBS 123094]